MRDEMTKVMFEQVPLRFQERPSTTACPRSPCAHSGDEPRPHIHSHKPSNHSLWTGATPAEEERRIRCLPASPGHSPISIAQQQAFGCGLMRPRQVEVSHHIGVNHDHGRPVCLNGSMSSGRNCCPFKASRTIWALLAWAMADDFSCV